MIKLRALEPKDAPYMLEWMHDPDIQKGFKRNMLDASMDDVITFINEYSNIPEKIISGMSLHYALVEESDEYLGTASLKNIDIMNGTAEYAITTRKIAQGGGKAYNATMMMLKKAFSDLGLRRVYLSVYSNNYSAINLYEKCGFIFEGEFRKHFVINGQYVDWKWYGILADEFQRLNSISEK